MTSTPLAALTIRHGLAEVDSRNIDAFLAAASLAASSLAAEGEPPHALLFFTGDPLVRPEAADVAVVLPELLAAFRGRLRAAVIARTSEDALKVRFHVAVLPSLVLVRGSETLGVLARIRTWPDYVARISAWLDPATPAMAPAAGPRVAFTFSGQGSQA